MDYLDLRRFCSTQRAVILPSVRMLNRAGEELSPVWGITPDACAVGAGVAVAAGCAVGAGVAVAVLLAGAVVGAAVGSSGFGKGAALPCAAFNAAPGGRMISVLFMALSGLQRLSVPS